jgi:hypothetical protein
MATMAQIQLLIADPDSLLTADDYAAILAIESDLYRAAALAARALAAKYLLRVSTASGPVKVEAQQRFDHCLKLAGSYDLRARENGGSTIPLGGGAPEITGISIDAMEAVDGDSDRPRSLFRLGLMDDNSDDNSDDEQR